MAVQLDLGLLLGVVAHPGEALNVLIQRFLQRVDHLEHARLAVGAERCFDVALAQSLAERAVDQIDAALPAILILFLPGQRLAHFEVGVDEWLREPRRSAAQHMPAHIGLQRIERQRRDHAVHLLEEIRIGDVQLR